MWLKHLTPLWVKQADEIGIVPPKTPPVNTSPAPDYHRGTDPNRVCDNCAFNDPRQSYCTKYAFRNDPTYTCSSWTDADLGLESVKLGKDSTSSGASKGDDSDSSSTYPPNLRAADLGGPSCMSCQYYQNVLGQCQKYNTRTFPMQVCDDWEGGQALAFGTNGSSLQVPDMGKIGSARQENPANYRKPLPIVQPIKPIPLIDGSRPHAGRPQQNAFIRLPVQQRPQPQPNSFQGLQPNPQAWRPSAVAQVAAAEGDPDAWVLNLFKPQAQQQAPSPTPMKQAAYSGDVLTRLYVNHFTKRANIAPLITSMGLNLAPSLVQRAMTPRQKKKSPVQPPSQGSVSYLPQGITPEMPKLAAVHAVGDPLPKDWNKHLSEPTKKNGGVATFGREAWDSIDHYRRKESDKDNFDKAWHMKVGLAAALGKKAAQNVRLTKAAVR